VQDAETCSNSRSISRAYGEGKQREVRDTRADPQAFTRRR